MRASSNARPRLTQLAIHQSRAPGVRVPLCGDPTDRTRTIPATSADAPSHTDLVIRWAVSQTPNGSEMTRLSVTRDCTSTSEPRCSATAWQTQPTAITTPPSSQTGRRKSCTRNRRPVTASSACNATFCCRTVPRA